ncbi:MAG: response regulator [Acidimicrobiales bacterium]
MPSEHVEAPLVLVVEDEPAFVEALSVGLAREGFRIEVATDGVEALICFERTNPDLVLLDVMLPRLSGIDVCRQLRQQSHVPIIMVTAKGAEIDTVVGLEVGADDYLAKPFRMRELVARIRSLLRRSTWAGAAHNGDEPRLEAGDVTIDLGRHEVMIRGQHHELPRKEFDLLALLISHAGRVITRDGAMSHVWGEHYVGDTKTLDVHVKRLRAKVETDPANPARIITIRGVGYKFVPVGPPS